MPLARLMLLDMVCPEVISSSISNRTKKLKLKTRGTGFGQSEAVSSWTQARGGARQDGQERNGKDLLSANDRSLPLRGSEP